MVTRINAVSGTKVVRAAAVMAFMALNA